MARRKTLKGMTVEELVAELQEYPPDAIVAFSYTWPDHWRTEVAETVEAVEPEQITWSEYHDKFKTVEEETEEEAEEHEAYGHVSEFHDVVMLRG